MASAAQLPDPGARTGLRYRVRTPENVFFEFEVAGLATRCLAWLIDLLILVIGSLVIALLVGFLPLPGGFRGAAVGVAIFLFIWGYHIYFEYSRDGATIGKRKTGLQVISDDGLPIDLWQAVVRNLMRIVDFLTPVYFLGLATALAGRWYRRPGDLVAGTIVVRKRSLPGPEEVIAPNERYNSLIEDYAMAARLRQGIRSRERETLVSLCLRRNELDLGPRLDLFRLAAASLRERFPLPTDPWLSEERLVLNVTAVLVGRAGPGGGLRI
jgi:uncharacterized RDD family membrane protein YckC